jgi:hypothetical protein
MTVETRRKRRKPALSEIKASDLLNQEMKEAALRRPPKLRLALDYRRPRWWPRPQP